MTSADYIEHCAGVLRELGYRVTARTLADIATEHRALAQQPAAGDGALSIGQRVEWQDSVGRWWPCRITGWNPATYTARLDDGTDANGYARGRFRIATKPQGDKA